ncbi:MAG: hypothetical protein SGBAC_011122 [Bacillariaceae sp.]
MTGSIIVIEDKEGDKPSQAFWLARKVEKNVHGVTRVGYKLRPNTHDKMKNSNGNWELDIDESCVHPLVTIKIVHTKILDDGDSSENNMMSFLQMIGNDNSKDTHVDGTNIVATCADYIYIVLPYHRDGSLDAYCRLHGNLTEPVARFLFCQVLQGMKTLQSHGLCHRDLSLDAISLDGNHVSITESRFPVRCKTATSGESHQSPPVPAGSQVQYIAPEYFRGSEGPWNGYAADLWACGLILYSMVIGADALFLAPLDDDRTFVKLCLKGQIRSLAFTYGELIGESIELSDDVVDLLQKMLKVDPHERLNLSKIMEHPWVANGELMTPGEWEEEKKVSVIER